ncbi:uncharacterized protein LOC130190575 isoform X2 [Pseudoliparis swirei]|uniref:uncharacterized protein LOC130190575 isoform X2 n=1 Tax=Pseudoliparis swirei TaxID=2059687 RepID=UPI0024BE8485|nr:uncharacterized protein LOC130190575 isoform X2 [Pseudoliparis swirei]
MEKSQWDLKKIRFQRRRLTRLDDFVHTSKTTLKALLREYSDSLKRKKKSTTETIIPQAPTTTKDLDHNEKAIKGLSTSLKPTDDEDAQGCTVDSPSQLQKLWGQNDTEVVVSEIPSQFKGNSFMIHHSELRTLRPQEWLAGEVIECLLHHTLNELHLGNKLYILNYYTANVILFGKREAVRRNSLSKINFEDYEGIVSFVNVHNTHWKFLYISAAQGSIYLVDPFHTSTELADSNNAAKRFREYFKM